MSIRVGDETIATSVVQKQLVVASSPQYFDRSSTAAIMWSVSACLAPAAFWGVYVFGLSALWVLLAATAAAVGTEFGIARLMGRALPTDGSAFLTGLLVGMNMPPQVPVMIPVVASVFAIAVVKWTFGGLGCNWMNPALAGRAFVFFSWTGEMTTWKLPATVVTTVDTVTGASPLGYVDSVLMELGSRSTTVPDILRSAGYPRSALDGRVTEWLNGRLLQPLGISLPGGYIDPFVGNIAGSIGEVSALLLLLGSVYLFARKIITWHIPTAAFGVFAVFVYTFDGLRFGTGLFSGDVLFNLFTGGFVLALFYMATDMVTSPMSGRGMLIYGAGVGFFTFLIRTFGSLPEGASLAVLLMNIFVPMINRYTRARVYGHTKERRT